MFEQRDGHAAQHPDPRGAGARRRARASRARAPCSSAHGLHGDDIAAWIMHAGGRDVLLALERRFECRRRRLPLQRGDAARVRQPVERLRLLRARGGARRRRARRLVVAVVVRRRLQLPRRAARRSADDGGRRATGAARRRSAETLDGLDARRPGGAALAPRPAPRQRRSWARARIARAARWARCSRCRRRVRSRRRGGRCASSRSAAATAG